MPHTTEEINLDTEFLSGYVEAITFRYPESKKEEKLILRMLVAGTNRNYQNEYRIHKNGVSALWKRVVSCFPEMSASRNSSYRKQLLSLLDKTTHDYKKEYAEYLAHLEVQWEHEDTPKPSRQEVISVVASQDKSLSAQLYELLPGLTEKEWNLIDAYRATL